MKPEEMRALFIQFEMHSNKEEDIEYWYARDLMNMLGYKDWRNFRNVIDKAKIACESCKPDYSDHFVEITHTVTLGNGATREIEDMMLTRYACYLIAQNGDPRKEPIRFAQNYFALQTRKQELLEQRLLEHERLNQRKMLQDTEKEFSSLIYQQGIDNAGFARIRSYGDSALFGGKATQDMKNKLDVPSGRPLADFLPSVTIAAKNLATTMTTLKMQQEDIQGETPISREHTQNNTTVRKALTDRGIYPEELPASEDIKKVERRHNSDTKKLPMATKKLPDNIPPTKLYKEVTDDTENE